MRRRVICLLAAIASCASVVAHASASICPRLPAGAAVAPPPDVTSEGGLLRLTLEYRTGTDAQGRTTFCFQTPDGAESPTLRVQPGDKVQIKLVNRLPPAGAGKPVAKMLMPMSQPCGDITMTTSSVNIHFHGMNISPSCHSDEVLRTVVNPGQSFLYSFIVPPDEPPGLYWYHPHIHGISSAAVLGGASGAIVVGGIQTVQPALAGLPERLLVIRDQRVPGVVLHGAPTADLSLNYVPISSHYIPAVIGIAPGQREFWRVLNASSDTIMDLRLLYDGHAQPVQIAALDGVPTGSQDGRHTGTLATVTHIAIPPAGRAEFIVTGPAAEVKTAALATQAIDTGPAGDADPARPLATLVPATGAARTPLPDRGAPAGAATARRFAGLDNAPVTTSRTLYFSEAAQVKGGGDGLTDFFITVEGAQPVLYDPANPPAIITRQGAVEDWTIENRSTEIHEFHIHQIHFEVLMRNGRLLPSARRQVLDTVQVPYWAGAGPYPSVTVRMDFRGQVVGDFVYHCHILDHEDGGMMAIIRVLPKAG